MKLDRKVLRSMIIQEAKQLHEARLIHERNCYIADKMILKEQELVSAGCYSRREINEGVIDSILGFLKNVPGGFIDYFKQAFITMLLKKLGFTVNSLMGSTIINILERIEITKLSQYIGEGKCDALVDVIFDGISESLQEQLPNYLFGVKNTGEAGFVAGTAREAFAKYINDSEFALSIKSEIKKFICSESFANIGNMIKDGLSGVKNSVADVTGLNSAEANPA